MSAALSVHPNPVTQQAIIAFTLSQVEVATVTLYDVQGRRAQQLFAGPVAGGVPQRLSLVTNTLAAGIYSVQLSTQTQRLVQRIVVAK
ncbi:T9SS type A sorting domain-containing protein [Hymenobacter defluvii]|uniref:T9SS type A sorting domain-containing protein n=1 Tax=Hymenobacter defluvii TaxID=2054411 RepID=A0ABS3THZ5_9BACT|nr:T9SS type A sorting domain-containing protein [Hymenobacter defluvii]MBO3273258.1 T9SS type A sorting domain-containing protein [Hymenobacter defluvii]